MTTAVQHRRGTTSEHSTFTGLEGEVTIDTTKDTAVIHDGVLAGGYPLAKENLANVTTSGLSSIDGASTASDDKFFIYDQSATTLKTITRAELNNAIEQDALANVAITGGTINGTTIGGTTAAGGSFTTLSSTGNTTLGDASGDTVTINGTANFANVNPTLTAGTANGVAYLNGSKVLTTGSALTFDGTTFNAPNSVITSSSSSTALRITQTGSGNALVVEDSANPDATPTVIDATGRIVVGHTSPVLVSGSASFAPSFEVIGTSFSNSASAVIRYSNDTGAPSYTLAKSRSTTFGSFSVVGSNDSLGQLIFDGDDGTAFRRGAEISAFVDGTPGANDMPGRLVFGTTADGASSPTERYRISNDGTSTWSVAGSEQMRLTSTGLGIGTSSPGAKLHVDSGATGLLGIFNSTNANGGYITGQSSGSAIWDFGSAKQVVNTGGASDVALSSRSGFLAFGTGNSERARIDSSGNLGLGVTPSAWSGVKAIQISSATFASTGIDSYLFANSFYNGSSDRYIGNGYASYYAQSAGKHLWYTAPSGTAGNAISFTQAMTLDASGRLGVGTTSPSSPIHVVGNSASNFLLGGIRINDTNTSSDFFIGGVTGGGFQIATAGGATRAIIDSSGNLLVGTTVATYNAAGRGVIEVNGGSTAIMALKINGGQGGYTYHDGSVMSIGNVLNGPLAFFTNNAEKARIDSSGNTLFNTTTAGITNSLSTTIETSGANNSRITVNHSSVAGSSNDSNFMQFGYGGNLIGRIVQASTTTVSYTTTSDYRLKENVQPIIGALAKVAALKPCTYTWKSAPNEIGEGFIAHELAEVCPQAVAGEKDAVDADGNPQYQGIDTSFLVSTLTAALQELNAKVEAQAAEIAALKGQA